HLYQIWLFPDAKGLKPSYEQRTIADEEKRGRWRLIASPDGEEGSMTINQDARLYLAGLTPGGLVSHAIAPGRAAWLQVLRGDVKASGQELKAGDGAAITHESGLSVQAQTAAEVLLFDLA